MMNGDRKEGICRLNVDGNGCDYLRILSDLETKLRNNTNPKEKIELALQGALMFYGADRAYVIEVDDELGIGVNTYECCAPGIAPEIDNLQFMPFEMFPRWLCSLKSDTPIIITNLEQIKTEFLEEYRYLEKRSVNSLLAVPFQKRLNAGFLGVDNPKRNVEDPGFLRLVILCIVVELNEILLQEWRERRYASIKQPTIIQANLFGKLEIISATDVLKDDSFTNESGYVLLTFLLLNRKREHPLRLLTDVIWESTDMGNPYNSIKNVVYRLRKTLACIGLRAVRRHLQIHGAVEQRLVFSVHLMHQLRHIPQVALSLHCLPQLVGVCAVQLVLLIGIVDDPVLLAGGHLPAVEPQRYAAFLAQVPQDGLRFGAGGVFPQRPYAAVGIAEDVVIHLELHHARCDAIQKGADKCLLR